MLAVVLLGEAITPGLLVAGALMALGVWLHLSEKHGHPHVHESVEHEHYPDEHHRHSPGPATSTGPTCRASLSVLIPSGHPAYGKLVTMVHCLSSMRRSGSDASSAGRRPVLRAALAAILVPALGVPARPARAGLNLLLNEFTLTRDELQAELAGHFPIARRYGDLASVSLHDPQLALDGSANRATLASRLVIVSPLLRPSSRGGQAAVSSGLRWDGSGLAVRLQDPRAEQLRIEGVTGNDARTLERISAALVQEALQDYPLRTFRPEELRLGLKVQGITIGVDEIKVRFE